MFRIRNLWAQYAAAVLVSIAALFLRFSLTPLLGDRNLYHTAWLAVVISAWYCGLGPSIAAMLISGFGVWYGSILSFEFSPQNREGLFGLIGFFLFSLVIIGFGESSRRGQTARSKLAAIVDSSDDAIVSKSLDGIISSWNAGAERIFEWTSAEVIGKPITIIVPPELRHQEAEILKRLRAGEHISHFETVRVTKSGKKVDVSLTISPLRDAAGKIIGASKTGRDVTMQKATEAKLKAAQEDLEERVRQRTRQLLEKNEALASQTKVVQDLSARLLQLQDIERRNIARELHDSVGQMLAALSMNIAAVKRERERLSVRAQECVDENAGLVDQISQEIRTISHLLHPPLLDEIGLGSAIKWFIDGFSERSKILVSLDMPDTFERLSSDREIAIFRVVQECLTNIHRHSGSSQASIRLARENGNVHLEVRDAGKGIPPEKLRELNSSGTIGVGFRGMRERLRQLDGNLEIKSEEEGTVIIATLPLDHPSAN